VRVNRKLKALDAEVILEFVFHGAGMLKFLDVFRSTALLAVP